MSSIPHNQNKENEVFEFAAKFISCARFFLAAALNVWIGKCIWIWTFSGGMALREGLCGQGCKHSAFLRPEKECSDVPEK